ncbi:MAG TPA: hypothetical protein VGC88_08205 [Terriglobales bacterium]|jgi:hypothetical protein
MMRTAAIRTVAALSLLSLSGCSKRYVELSLTNNSTETLRTVEIDYPGGSFGKTNVPPGQSFHYRFKSLHDGQLKLIYSDNTGEHQKPGPDWKENQSGTMTVSIGASGVVLWQTSSTK